MLPRFLNYLSNKIRGQPTNVVSVVPSVQSQSKPKIQAHPPRSILAFQNAQLHAAQQQIHVEYRLVLGKELSQVMEPQEQEKQEMHAEIIDEVYQLSKNLEKLSVSEENLEKANQNFPKPIQLQTIKVQRKQSSVRRQFELKKQHQIEVKDFLGTKYTKEKADYPLISFDIYKKIKQFWKNKSKGHHEIKNTSFDCVQRLTYKALGGLQFGEWLNDDVINIYIEMMEKKFIRDQLTPFRILNSYFATSTLQKTDAQIQRVLKKKSLDKSQFLVMPINSRNHWYFAVFASGQITIHDSIRHQEQYYLENPIFKNALKFARMFYERDFNLSIRMDYPQQDNSYDCGVFMLMGIRDILRHKEWSYHQGDIRFKRIQTAYEILEETLIYVD